MSQFQQPQDNRYARPGVLDLGTGRQFERLSVSQRGIGSTGSGTGGGFVQGQSRTGTGLSGVDPLAQILGAASTGINAFLQADQTMAKAVDVRTNRQLDELEQQRQDDLVNPSLSPEDAAAAHRTRLDDWRTKNGPLSKRGTARAKYKGMKRDAIKAISDFNFENEYLEVQDLITQFGGDETMTIDALEQWVARYEDTPYEEQAIRQTRQQLQNARARKVNREIGEDVRDTQHRFKGLLVEEGFLRPDANAPGGYVADPLKILEFASQNNIDLNDENAHVDLGEEFLGRMDSRLQGLDFASREAVIRNWSAMFDQEANNFVFLAKALQQDIDRENANSANAKDWINVLKNPLSLVANSAMADITGQSTRDMGPVAAKEEAMTAFSRTAPASYDKISPTLRAAHSPLAKSLAYASFLAKDAHAAAKDVKSPELAIEILNSSLLAVPTNLDDAVQLGWVPMVDGAPRKGPNGEELDEEGWQTIRRAVEQQVRANYAEYAAPFFSNAASTAVALNDMDSLNRLGNQLIALSGEEGTSVGRIGPYGLREDGQSVNILPLSEAGQIFGSIEQKLVTAYNTVRGKTSASSGDSRAMTALRGGSRGLSYEMQVNGKDVEVPRSNFVAMPAMNAPAETFDDLMATGNYDVAGAIEKVQETYMALMASDPNLPVPPMVMETLELLDQLPKNGAPAPMVRGMLALAPSLGYQRTTGSTAGSSHRNIIGRQAQGIVAGVFERAEGRALSGDDAVTIGSMYIYADTPDMREALFPNADQRRQAQLAARILRNKKTFKEGDKFHWSGATSEDFRVAEMTFDNVQRGREFMMEASGVAGFDKLEGQMVDELLNPLKGAEPPEVPSPVSNGIQLMRSNNSEWIPELRETLGLPEDTDMNLWLSTSTNMPAIKDNIALRIANFLGTNKGQAATQNPEDMAEALETIVLGSIQDEISEVAIFDGFMLEDKDGGIRQLQKRAGKGSSATAGDLLSSALDYSIHDVVSKRGMTVMSASATAEHLGYQDMGDHYVDASGNPVEVQDNSAATYQTAFQDMFKNITANGQPLFSGADYDFDAVWNRAVESTPNKDPRQVSVGDLLFYSWALENKGGENFTRDKRVMESTNIRVEDGRTFFRVDRLNVEFEFAAPMTLDGNLAPAIASSRQVISDDRSFKVTPEMRQQQHDQGQARFLYEMRQPGHFMTPRTTADGRTPKG